MADLETLKQLAEAATPGPWVTKEHLLHDHDRWGQLMEIYTLERREECLPHTSKSPDVYGPDEEIVGDEPIIQVITNPPKDRCKADAAYIAAANPQAVLDLIAQITRLTQERDEAREQAEASQALLSSHRNAMENAFIGWGMGWDLEGVMQVIREELDQTSAAAIVKQGEKG